MSVRHALIDLVRLFVCLVAVSSCTTPSANDAAPDTDATERDANHDDSNDTCTNFSGIWTLSRATCPALPLAVCIVQRECDVVAYPSSAPSSSGRAETSSFTIGRGCTFREIAPGTLSVVCTSDDGTQRCLATATRADTPAAAPVCCDPFAHDCAAGARCGAAGVESPDHQFVATSACFPGGQRHEGEPCSFDWQTTPDMLCASGLECFLNVCRPICDSNGQPCAAPNLCVPVSDVPTFGACVPGCTLIDDVGCPADETCRLIGTLAGNGYVAGGLCSPIGMQPIGGDCENWEQCPARSGCFLQGPSGSTGHCLPLCHIGTDECGVGYHCVTLVQPMVTEIGYCAPL